MFPSAPGAQAGRNRRAGQPKYAWFSGFQSAPGAQAGRNLLWVALLTELSVFQSAPGAQAGRNTCCQLYTILRACFNPHPALRPGGTSHYTGHWRTSSRFQSAPGAQAGRNACPGGCQWVAPVSIRPRRSGREELSVMLVIAEAPEFQSAPGAQAGRNRSRTAPALAAERFNPPPAAPGREGTERREDRRLSARGVCFNPPPAAQAGRNFVEHEHPTAAGPVSIRPRRSGREEPAGPAGNLDDRLCFNPPPALRPGGTRMVINLRRRSGFSIRPRRAGREEQLTPHQRLMAELFQSAPGAQAGRNPSDKTSTPR